MFNLFNLISYWPVLLVAGAILLWYYRSKIASGVTINKTSTPTLDRFSRDLTKLARDGKLDPVIGRENEITRAIQILSRRTQNNPVLVGKAGVGKTAIAEGLAQRVADGQVPTVLKDKRVLALNLSDLISGTKYRGEFEERMKHITDEIVGAKRSIILFVDEVHMLAGAGEAVGGVSAKDILKPALSRGDLQMIGATTPEEFDKYIKDDKTLARRLEPMFVEEPSLADTETMLKGVKKKYESYHEITIPDNLLKNIVKLAGRCFPDRSFPDKAIDLLDETASRIKLVKKAGQKSTIMTLADIEEVVKEKQVDRAHFKK
ncbi:MAG: AAA family ATPase [bacterium]